MCAQRRFNIRSCCKWARKLWTDERKWIGSVWGRFCWTLSSGTAAAKSGSLCCRLPLFPSGRKVGPLEKPSCRYYTRLLYMHFSSTTTLDRSWCSASHPWTFTHSVLKDALCATRLGRLFHYHEIKDWWPTYLLLVTSLLPTAASLQPACSALF